MSDWDDETLRRAYAAGRRKRADLPASARPSVDEIAAAIDAATIDSALSSDDRERILDQALTTGAADELALLQAVHHASAQAEAKQASGAVTRLLSRWPLAAAAVVMLAIGWPTAQYLFAPAELETVRSATSPDDAVSIVSPAPGTSLAAGVVLRWRAVPSASSYVVEMLDDRGQVRLRHETNDIVWTIGAGADLSSAASATGWWVIARMADGTTRRSDLRLLRAADKP